MTILERSVRRKSFGFTRHRSHNRIKKRRRIEVAEKKKAALKDVAGEGKERNSMSRGGFLLTISLFANITMRRRVLCSPVSLGMRSASAESRAAMHSGKLSR